MSKRRQLRVRIVLFDELRAVLDAMRNVALVEIGKLTRSEKYRRRLLEELVGVAEQTSAYQPVIRKADGRRLYIVVGSERGFCGDFNERVAAFWQTLHAREPSAAFIVVGTRLGEKLRDEAPLAVVGGALSADEVDGVLLELLGHVRDWQKQDDASISISIVAHDSEEVGSAAILPFEPARRRVPTVAPTLNIAPAAFLRQFIDQYVDARLHDAFAASLLAENHARLQHMAAAIGRVDESLGALRRRSRRMRQAEITQEVEMILLAAGDQRAFSSVDRKRSRSSSTVASATCLPTAASNAAPSGPSGGT
jgi:F-type H+-transporting ATPase subunit gamma